MLNAAALAATLDPERKVLGWWQVFCPMCLKEMLPASKNVCEHCDIKAAVVFTGPADLHTAREHAWMLEDWLKSRDCRILSSINMTYVDCMFDGNIDYENISENDNHTAALVAAIERIANEQ